MERRLKMRKKMTSNPRGSRPVNLSSSKASSPKDAAQAQRALQYLKQLRNQLRAEVKAWETWEKKVKGKGHAQVGEYLEWPQCRFGVTANQALADELDGVLAGEK